MLLVAPDGAWHRVQKRNRGLCGLSWFRALALPSQGHEVKRRSMAGGFSLRLLA
jgi:hypothetical protein